MVRAAEPHADDRMTGSASATARSAASKSSPIGTSRPPPSTKHDLRRRLQCSGSRMGGRSDSDAFVSRRDMRCDRLAKQ